MLYHFQDLRLHNGSTWPTSGPLIPAAPRRSVEDCENIDSASLDLLDSLMASLSDTPLFLLVAVRSSEGVREPAMQAWLERPRGVTHIAIGPLASDAAQELVASYVEGAALPEEVVAFIVSHSGGIPLNLEQASALSRQFCLLDSSSRCSALPPMAAHGPRTATARAPLKGACFCFCFSR